MNLFSHCLRPLNSTGIFPPASARHWIILGAALLVTGLAFVAPRETRAAKTKDPAAKPAGGRHAAPAPTALTDEKVLESMRRGITFLLSCKKGDNFEVHGKPWLRQATEAGGETALVLYALLHSAESLHNSTNDKDKELSEKLGYRSPELAPVIKWLCAQQPDGTYAAALTACALQITPKSPETTKVMERLQAFLLSAASKEGGFGYAAIGAAGVQSKLAELRTQAEDARKKNDRVLIAKLTKEYDALEKTLQAGNTNVWVDNSNSQYGILGMWAISDYEVETPTEFWKIQDHYWRSSQLPDGAWPYQKERPTMSLLTMTPAAIATLFVTQEFLPDNPGLDPREDKCIDAGLASIAKAFAPNDNNQYYMYALERVGLAAGFKFLGTRNWYHELAQHLVATQGADGSWTGAFAGAKESRTVPTAYALLTLARGRNPVAFNKLQYAGPWNARPRDDAHLTEKMSKNFERPINWQIVNLQVSPDEWLDAPVLLITGSRDPHFTAADLAKLSAYVHAGGIIFSTADGGRPEFTNAIKKIVPEVCGRQYEMRELPKDHYIFNLWSRVERAPLMLGVSNGAREMWIHSTLDMGESWQGRHYASKACWDVPENLYFYASGKRSLRAKLDSLRITAAESRSEKEVRVARLALGGNPDPEPGAWPRLVKVAAAKFGLNVKLSENVPPAKLPADKPTLAHLTGTTVFKATDEEVKALKTYLDGGGTLFADATGGSPKFTSSFQELAGRLYPSGSLDVIAPTEPLYKSATPATTEISFRNFSILNGRKGHLPQIRGIKDAKGRYVILFSELDITSGLLNTNTWGIDGYTPESAEALANCILHFAAH